MSAAGTDVGHACAEPLATPGHVDVLIVGAGLSGIDAAYHLQRKCKDRSYAIFEARAAVGGTWDLFRYPGVRSDSDMSTLGFPFRPWQGEKAIADGADIRQYIEDTAHEFGIFEHIRFNRRVLTAAWSSRQALWTVTFDQAGETRQMTCAFLMMCSGYYDYASGYRPDFPNEAAFKGRWIHPQAWPADFAPEGQRVVVIGSGATAITLAPALAARGAKVVMLQRSPSYIVSRPSRDRTADRHFRVLPAPLASFLVRWKNVGLGAIFYRLARKRPERVRRLILDATRRQLPDLPDVDRHFTPRYNPWDQRLCLVPDGDLFRALRKRQAEIVTDTIDHVTAEGLALGSGRVLPADAIVTATGLTIKLMGGVSLTIDGVAVDVSQRMIYKGMMLDGVPNLILAFGYTNASWTLKIDLVARYACRLLNHMDRLGAEICMAEAPDADVAPEPMLDFTSGYVRRAGRLLPKQGGKAPWRVHQNYALDLIAFGFGKLEDHVMTFRKVRQPETMMNLYCRTAVITGAGSGIGRAIAAAMAKRGAHLALADRNEAGLEATSRHLAGFGSRLSLHKLDVSDPASVKGFPEQVLAEHGGVDILVNNAGVALGGTFEEVSEADFEWLFSINFWGVVRMTRAFLPLLKQSEDARLVNLSSLFGLIAPPGQAAYSASKFAVRGFSDSLRKELAGTPVCVTVVHPGGVATRIASDARRAGSLTNQQIVDQEERYKRLLRLPPEIAGERIVKAIEKRRDRILVGSDAKIAALIERLMPVSYWTVMGPRVG